MLTIKYINLFFYSFLITIFFFLIPACTSTHLAKNSTTADIKYSANSLAIKRTPLNESERKRLLIAAQKSLGHKNLKVGNKVYRGDCSGTIRAIFTEAKIGLGGILKKNNDNDVKAIYRYIQKYGKVKQDQPVPGDLVFFHNTYDRNKKGQMNNALTHIGIVEKVEGTIVHFIHHLGGLIIRSRMDLSLPHDTYHPKTGVRVNHILRRGYRRERAHTSAELFAGFGHL